MSAQPTPARRPSAIAVTRRRARRLAAAALATLGALLLLLVPSSSAAPASFAGISGDGETAFFTTTEQLVPGDTDTRNDVYERSYDEALERYVTREVSTGPIGGNDAFPALFNGASVDGLKVFFSTEEALVAEDVDRSEDVYMRDLGENATVLVSAGDSSCAAEACGKGEVDSSFAPGGVVPSGNKAFFRSAERLASDDGDGFIDVYVRDLTEKRTTLVSKGDPGCAGEGCGSGNFAAVFRGASEDGTKAFLATDEKLTGADQDSLLDIYQRNVPTGVTTLVSAPLDCPGVDCSVSYGGASSDGSHVYFETNERLSLEDGDSSQDVYDWSGGVETLVSTGPSGNGPGPATFAGSSSDGAAVFFLTSDSLVPGDGDSSQDVYRRAGGVTTLVSTGAAGGDAESPASLRWVSPDGSSASVLFDTDEALTAADKDKALDIYRWSAGVTTLVSTGPAGGNGEFNAGFSGASGDGADVFLVTLEPLVAQDTDTGFDVYDIAEGTVRLVSTGPVGGQGPASAGLPAGGVADDGSHAFFTTDERLTVDDLDAETDIYDGFPGGTLLVSTGNSAPLGPPTPSQLSTDPASPGQSLTPRVKGQSDPNTAIKIYATSDCSGAPVATGTRTELGGAGIAVAVSAGSTTSFRATATDLNGDTSPCSAAVSYTQQSAPPPPPPPDPGGGGGGGSEAGTGGGSGGTAQGGTQGGGSKHGDVAVHVTPHTRITFGPASKTRARRPVFRFADSTGQEGTIFACKVDRGGWHSCGSPQKLKRLQLGRHVFQVKAVNAVGAPEPAPVKRSFKVVGR
jgi:hypothetical protein